MTLTIGGFYGQQSLGDEEYIEDNNVYLSEYFFMYPEEQVITFIHEISHLVEGEFDFDECFHTCRPYGQRDIFTVQRI